MSKKPAPKLDYKDNQTKIDQLEYALKRALADFDNLQKRVEREREIMGTAAKISLITKLLPIIDNFARAKRHIPKALKDNAWVTGIMSIGRHLDDLTTELGLVKIPAQPGEQFNPFHHEAVAHQAHASIPADHVIDEVESGYLINGQVVRPAKVRVSAGPIDKNVK